MGALPLPVTALTAAVCALMAVALGLNVVRVRLRRGSALGTDDAAVLQAARAHGNFAENVPLALVLLGLAEMQVGANLLVELCGWTLVASRAVHAVTLLQTPLPHPGRVVGMVGTWLVMLAAALVLGYHWLLDRI